MTTPVPGLTAGSSQVTAGIALGLAASLAFGTSGVFATPLFEAGWTPGAAVFWRVLIAAVALLPFSLWQLRGRFGLLRTQWRPVLGFGVLSVAVSQLCYFAAVDRMDVGIALLLEYLAPVALVLLAWVRTRRPPVPLVLAGVVVSVIGLLCVLDLAGATPDPLGVLFAFGAMVGAASYFVIAARPSPLPPLALPGLGLAVGAVLLGLACLIGILPYAAPLVEVSLLGTHLPWWLPLGVVGLVAGALAYSLGVAGIARMGERLSSFVSLSEVLFAVLLAALLLHQVPSAVQLTGGVLVVAGVVLIRLAANRDEPAVPALTATLPDAEPEPAQP
ncbi:MAG: EamA family transporter [Propionicimonas sp.]|uniref:EamA family transporter n=1 Tax=Propionicimonas sp. TaxID=1955623 RepID=UPI002B1EE837|nr:EamA family transporter [Propionicimonas sp.]MEA4942836.1 EamA family transporter [Propionicimonas sp.]MEA5119130.1 EamA family transporter [Propionicimonas sp.]